ncbi:hypothetical protein BSLG_001906 [Batrachochytrium salamandrivorans]|nr:hypothetical protein BSLG_001906 [Batrachochytrium salamandrivorans]
MRIAVAGAWCYIFFSPSTNTIYELSDASAILIFLSRRRASEANPLDILPPSQPFIPSPFRFASKYCYFSQGDARKVAGSSYQSAASTSIYDMSDSDNDEASTDASLNTVHPEETTMPLHQESRDPSGPIHSPLYDNRPRSPSQPSLRTAAFIPPELLSQFDSQADVFYRSEIGNNPLFQHRIINLSAPGVLAPSRDISNADIATESTVDLSHTSISAPNLFVRTDQETTTAKSPIALKTNDDNGLTEDDDATTRDLHLEDVIIDAEDDISVCDIDNVIPAHLELLPQNHLNQTLSSAFSQSPQVNSVSSNHDQVDHEALTQYDIDLKRSSTTDRLHSQTSSAIAARNGILIDDANIMDSASIPTLQPCNMPDKCKGDALEMECHFWLLVAYTSPSIFSKRTQPSSQDLSTDTSMNILQSKAKKVGSSGHTPNAALLTLDNAILATATDAYSSDAETDQFDKRDMYDFPELDEAIVKDSSYRQLRHLGLPLLSEDPLHRQPPKALIAPKNKIAVVCLLLHSSQGSTCEKSTDSKDTFESDRRTRTVDQS